MLKYIFILAKNIQILDYYMLQEVNLEMSSNYSRNLIYGNLNSK